MLRLFARAPSRIERDVVLLALGDGEPVPATRVWHPRARRIRLSVDERGVRITLPPRAAWSDAERFVLAHADWLRDQLAALQGDASAPLQPFHTAQLPLRGMEMPVHWQAGRSHAVRLADEALHISVRGDATEASPALRRALRDFYEAQARADVARWLPHYRDGLPKPPSRIVFKRMASQWGSLSPGGVIALDLSLVLAPPAAFEYVLVHELCHLIHHDHSRAFWREVQARCPQWRAQRDWFQQQGRALKARLRALTG